MAFVFEADRTSSGPLQQSNPGPGQYVAHRDYRVDRGYAPFLSTVERGVGKKITKETLPGPGSYDQILTIGNSLNKNTAFHSTLIPEKEPLLEQATHTNVFKSKTKRFEYKIDTDQPGPGKYYKDKSFVKPLSTSAIQGKSFSAFPIQSLTKDNRTAVPSIPSYTHSYGYSETEDHKLTLNKNPLIEIQQFVGPGYYDTKDEIQSNTNKGTTWHKFSSQRFGKLASSQVGPGTYEAVSSEGPQPLYKTKPSSSFLSNTGRVTFGKNKSKTSMKFFNTKSPDNANFAIGVETPFNGVESDPMKEANLDDIVPGPGHYYSEGITSSIKPKYKPAKFQFFGSGSERFGDDASKPQLGPGEYSIQENAKNRRSRVHAPFQSTEEKLRGPMSSALGPGVYDTKTTIVDRVKDKAKKGYLGSFGSTEMRFKPEKVPEVIPERVKFFEDSQPRTRPNMDDDQRKASHFFVPPGKKPILEKYENPPPGAYDVNYYDLAKKVSQTESSFFTAKTVPFKTSEARFKVNPETTKAKSNEEFVDEYLVRKRQTVMKPGIKQTPASMFASKSQRSLSSLSKNGPAPGTYHNSAYQDSWLKKTFNIKYIEEKI